MAECTGHTRDGLPCRNWAQAGSDFCASCTGKLHFLETNKVSRHSKFLPKRLLESYQASMEDRDLQALKAEIAMIDARIDDLLSRTETDGDGTIYESLIELANLVTEVWDLGDERLARSRFDQMVGLISRGVHDKRVWEAINENVDLRRKLSEAETKRLATLQQTITVEKAIAMITFMATTMRRIVIKYTPVETQRVILDDLSAELVTITGHGTIVETE